MTKKTKIYIGVGVGILLLGFLYLKNKQKKAIKLIQEQGGVVVDENGDPIVDGGEERSSAPSGGGGGFGGGSAPITTRVVTPSLFAPITALVLPVPRPTPKETTITPSRGDSVVYSNPTPIPTPRPILTNITSETKPALSSPTLSSQTLTSPIAVKPISTVASTGSPIPVPRTNVVSPVKSSFEGVGQQCFEVGGCLTDL